MFVRSTLSAVAVCGLIASGSAAAEATDGWKFSASIYAYLPTISGTSDFSAPPNTGGSAASVDIDKLLDNLQGAFMGSLDVSKGQWGGYTDLIYLDIGSEQSQTRSVLIGGRLPADASASADYSLKGMGWTFGGYYRALSQRNLSVDLIVGARLLDIEQALSWSLSGNVASVPVLDRSGNRSTELKNWDVLIGLKGRYAFGEGGKWFVPYYLDLGAGDSDLTVQAMTGVGYSFGWGDVLASWRYIDYQMPDGEPLKDLNFNGPAFAAMFHW
jgi:hypothetical protein